MSETKPPHASRRATSAPVTANTAQADANNAAPRAATNPPEDDSFTWGSENYDQDQAEIEKSRMPFLAHLSELRDRVRNSAIAFIVGLIGAWFYAKEIYEWLRIPLFKAWAEDAKRGEPYMVFSSVTEPFWVYMSVAMWAGIFVASPVIFYQLWKFIAPGLLKRERRVGLSFAIVSAFFFIGGALFCYYFVLPSLFRFLLGYMESGTRPMLVMTEYMEQTRNTMLAFGAVFELPIVLFALALVGVVTHRGLLRFNRWFIVIAFVVGAILTPSPDVVSQIFMAAPMIVLYNLSILGAYIVTKRREAKAAAARR